MRKITIRAFSKFAAAALIDLQTAYSHVYPDAPLIPAEVYLSPGFEGGQHVFCAFDKSGKLVGYAPLYPVLVRDASKLPHIFWTEVKVHPREEAPDRIKDQLFDWLLVRSRELARDFPGHPISLTFQYFPSETASIDYAISKGCQYTESVFTMKRDLSLQIQTLPSIDDVVIGPWRMESEAEQEAYVTARNECFPEAPIRLEEWQYFMQSPQWSVGTTFAAFHRNRLVANVAVLWDEAENQRFERKIGFTEYIFVLPAWRGKNIARQLIIAGLKHLQANGLDEAHLEVRAKNAGALKLYADLGYEVLRESRFYVLSI